jgi:hypothetical protein
LVGIAAYGAYSLLVIKAPSKHTEIKTMDMSTVSEVMHKELLPDVDERKAGEDRSNGQANTLQYEQEARAMILSRRHKIDLDDIPLPPGSFAIFRERQNKYVIGISASNQSSITDADLRFIIDMPLVELDLAHSSISGAALSSIAKIDTLEQLDIDGIKLGPENIRQLAKLQFLRHLSVSDCGLNDQCLKEMRSLKRLQELYVDKNPDITNAGLEAVSHLHLTALSLAKTGIDDGAATALTHLSDLTWIGLERCSVGDNTIAAASDMAGLRSLNLSRTNVTDAGLDRLKPRRLLNLSLSGCRDITPAAVARFMSAYPSVCVEYVQPGMQKIEGVGKRTRPFTAYPDEIK